ncbi:prepilin peptidase [Frondihabitans australicus]|uniref:Type IV leader peptidase family protein n=1 Tax=Frondihabitans australicus TaxID=386892 RepID=A0A495IHU4_9MICO|nr:prepilin peptidase [Frondihabitans australicus]RKR74988.1 type IV leader peptidase family protein [Frondihabitans australicus]
MIGLVDTLVILLLAAVGFAACASAPPLVLPTVLWLAFASPLLVRSDLARRRLPNVLTLPALGLTVATCAGGLIAPGADGIRAQDAGSALAAATATAAVGWLVARAGALGLGDVKLAASLVGSLWLVSPPALWLLACVASGAGVVAAVPGLRRARRVRRREGPGGGRAPTIPFGPCLLVGYWTALAVTAAAS